MSLVRVAPVLAEFLSVFVAMLTVLEAMYWVFVVAGGFVGQTRNLCAKVSDAEGLWAGRCLWCGNLMSVVRMVPVLAELLPVFVARNPRWGGRHPRCGVSHPRRGGRHLE
jgi:hypothetical protein